MASRRSLSNRIRLGLFMAARGCCAACQGVIAAGQSWDIDHIIPLALGGTDMADNLQILCRACHVFKTRHQDRPRIAKTERLRQRHVGAWRSKRPLPFGRRSKLKRTIGGRIVSRF